MTRDDQSITTVADRINSDYNAILFADTCAYLDLIRIPFRNGDPNSAKRNISSARSILSDNKIALISPPNVEPEFQRHFDSTSVELEKFVKRLERQINIVTHCAEEIKKFSIPSLSKLGLETALPKLAKKLLTKSIRLAADDTLIVNASNRAFQCIPPGMQGKSGSDCVIYLHALELTRIIRKSESSLPVVFLTSNTADYFEGRNRLHGAIQLEADELEMEFVTSWEFARHLVSPTS